MVRKKLNDLVNANPGEKYLCIISGPGKRLEGKYGPSWVYTVVYNNEEYVYFANSESHMLDIERPRSMGRGVNIWVEENLEVMSDNGFGKSTTKRRQIYYAEGIELTKDMPQTTQPDWDAIARRDKRHEYALEVFKKVLEEVTFITAEDVLKQLDWWVEYSMTGEVKKDGKTLSEEPF